jgi:sirohydrochlorin ferrochelatase
MNCIAMISTRAAIALPFLAATATSGLAGQTGLLVVAHGAGREWNDGVRATVARVGWPAGPVATAFLMGPEAADSGWEAGVRSLVERGAKQIVAVPLMVSSAGGHYRQIRFLAGASEELPAELADHVHQAGGPPVPVLVTRALDGAPEMGAVLDDLWQSLPALDRRRAIVFVAHGPSTDADAARWLEDLSRVAAPLAGRAGANFAIGLLRDDAPPPVRASAVSEIRRRIEALAAATNDSVTVLPVLVSRGAITAATIPRDLTGLPIRYVPASLTPTTHLARWIERVALAATRPDR